MSSTMNKATLFAAVLAMASSASAHIFIETPVPFSGVSKSPLEPSGSNFPCQGSGYQITSMNEWAVGSKQTISFPIDQTATHGGGSCQVSVTKDEKPTKDSVWKVIHSIEGGCPTSDSKGNLDTDPGTLGKYDFEVPAELPEGKMTMAWTWFNKVGNREMYMNCAPINVSGGTGKGFDGLPDMVTCNIAGDAGCKTKEGNDYTFANPGKSVAKLGTGPFVEIGGGAASGGGSTGSSGGSTSGSSTPAPSAPAAPAAPSTPDAAPKEPTVPKAPSTGGSTGGSTGPGTPCSEDGALLCNGESQFGICSNGKVVYQPVAAGTKCSGGKIARRDLHRNARSAIPQY